MSKSKDDGADSVTPISKAPEAEAPSTSNGVIKPDPEDVAKLTKHEQAYGELMMQHSQARQQFLAIEAQWEKTERELIGKMVAVKNAHGKDLELVAARCRVPKGYQWHPDKGAFALTAEIVSGG